GTIEKRVVIDRVDQPPVRGAGVGDGFRRVGVLSVGGVEHEAARVAGGVFHAQGGQRDGGGSRLIQPVEYGRAADAVVAAVAKGAAPGPRWLGDQLHGSGGDLGRETQRAGAARQR